MKAELAQAYPYRYVTSPAGERVRIVVPGQFQGSMVWRVDARMPDGEFYTQLGKNVHASVYVAPNDGERYALVKDYAENTGWLNVLVRAGIVVPTLRTVKTGHVELYECILVRDHEHGVALVQKYIAPHLD